MDAAVYCWILAGTFPAACITLGGCTCLDREYGRHIHTMGLTVILIWAVLWEITINKLNVYKTPTSIVVDKKKS